MKLLLDTNALIWWLRDEDKLGRAARALITDSDSRVLVSMVSLWEVTMKWRVGKMGYTGSSLLDDLESQHIAPLQITDEHLIALNSVEMYHKDPFDHLIIAQAKVEGATIITSDRVFTEYGVRCFPAGR